MPANLSSGEIERDTFCGKVGTGAVQISTNLCARQIY